MTTTEISVKMILNRWDASIKNCNELLNQLSDEELNGEVAPEKNRGIYLIGHLIAVHDDMNRLLDLGGIKLTEFAQPFLHSADKDNQSYIPMKELRKLWNDQVEEQKTRFSSLSVEEWFEKHTAVSAEDFSTDQTRNKLNIIITRTSHLQYHLGQLRLLK